MTQQKTIDLSRGTLQLTYQTVGDYQLDDLLDFAERINPKRAFLFVSKEVRKKKKKNQLNKRDKVYIYDR